LNVSPLKLRTPGLPAESFGDCGPQLQRALAEKLFPWALWVPGILHILHNITSNLCDQLEHYKTWISALRSVNAFFCHRWQLEVWLAACFSGDNREAQKRRLTQVKVSVLDHRWASLIVFLELLLEIEDIVREFWDFGAICDSQGWPRAEARLKSFVFGGAVPVAVRKTL
jgi:hypothetical protein